ncbi:MAG: peptidoglycan bridge formation glycyltransferase FemA/FemB family protein [Candidatus Doudnabacteria bacterium]|nr:peptidoglycan bridge formation glycyltransferase FemA/FemB family protein [Candidatus Doudnabacteria bacterium]
MQLYKCTEQDERDYNEFVSKQTSGSFLQAWQWGELQREYSNKDIRRFVVKNEDDIILAAQVISMPLFGTANYLYLPYGPVKKDDVGEEVLNFFIDEIKTLFPRSLFIRIEPKFKLTQPQGKKSINIQPARTLIIDLKPTAEEILQTMHPKTRYNIKVAQRHNVEIQKETAGVGDHKEFYSRAINLILETAKRQGYHTHPFTYYDTIVNFFKPHQDTAEVTVSVYSAMYAGSIVATGMMVDFGSTRTYLFGGSSNEHRNTMAPYLLHYTAMLDAKRRGLSGYDFDGLETSVGKEAGFARFKQGFGGYVIEYAGAYDIINNHSAYLMYRVLRKINRFINQMKY